MSNHCAVLIPFALTADYAYVHFGVQLFKMSTEKQRQPNSGSCLSINSIRLACVHKFGIKMYDIIRYRFGFKKQRSQEEEVSRNELLNLVKSSFSVGIVKYLFQFFSRVCVTLSWLLLFLFAYFQPVH